MPWLAAILALAAFVSPHPQTPQHYTSPDKSVVAVITPGGPKKSESQVELRSGAGKVLFHKDYTSSDGTHGYSVMQATWTPDSQFFIYSMEDSGGRAAWHSPTWFFSRKLNRMLSLDDALNDSISFSNFIVVAPDKITVTLWSQGSMPKRTVALSALLPKPASQEKNRQPAGN